MVRSCKDWRWSSYEATAGLESAPSFLTTEWILSQFGQSPSFVHRPSIEGIFVSTSETCAIATAYREYGYRLREIAEYLGVHYSTVRRRLKQQEERGMP